MASTSGLELLYHTVSKDFTSKEDAFVSELHWCMLINGYKCIGKNNEIVQNPGEVSSSEMLPPKWNENQDLYTLQYVHDDKTKRQGIILLNVVRVENTLLINAYNSENERTTSMTVDVDYYVDEDLTNFNSLYKNSVQFITIFQSEILRDLYPQPQREDSRSSENYQRQTPDTDLRDFRHIRNPGIPQSGSSRWSDYQDPLAIVGRGDLDPLGRSGGGMLVDPRQFPTAHQPFNPSAGIPGQLPRGSIPPGARFDPFAPPDPDIHPNNAPRPRGPNPDHMKPPGFDDMFS